MLGKRELAQKRWKSGKGEEEGGQKSVRKVKAEAARDEGGKKGKGRETVNEEEEKTECTLGITAVAIAAATLGRLCVAIPTLIANHFSSQPRRLLPIHFGGGGAPSSDCPDLGSFPSVYIRVSEKYGGSCPRKLAKILVWHHLFIPA